MCKNLQEKSNKIISLDYWKLSTYYSCYAFLHSFLFLVCFSIINGAAVYFAEDKFEMKMPVDSASGRVYIGGKVQFYSAFVHRIVNLKNIEWLQEKI